MGRVETSNGLGSIMLPRRPLRVCAGFSCSKTVVMSRITNRNEQRIHIYYSFTLHAPGIQEADGIVVDEIRKLTLGYCAVRHGP